MSAEMTEDQKRSILNVLGKNEIMTVATIRPDGYPQATTVTYVNDGLTLYFGTSGHTQKAQNILRCNKVSATIDGDSRNWTRIQGISLGGLAEVVDRGDESVRVYGLMEEKFPQIHDFPLPDMGAAVLIRITPQVISLIDYTKGFLYRELVAVPAP